MTRGWFVGDFEPTLLRTSAVEVAVKRFAAGEVEACHVHRVAAEVTAVVSGRVRMSGVEYGPDDVVVVEPGEHSDFEALEAVVVVSVKVPAVAGDKYECEGHG